MLNRRQNLFLLATAVTSMSIGSCSCAPAPAVTAVVLNTVIDVLIEFATATIPLKKFSRVAAALSVSGGKAALKLETEIGKNGIKIGGTYPVSDLKSAVAEAFRQTHGREPPQNFEVNFLGSALVITRGSDRFIFFIESTSFCVANIDEAALLSVDHEKKLVVIEVTEDLSDIRFSTTTEGCNEISTQIQERKKLNAIQEIKNLMLLLGLKDGILSIDSVSGNVEIEYTQSTGRVQSTFNPNLLRTKYGINTSGDVSTFRTNAQTNIDACSESAIQAIGNDTNSLHLARAECLTKEGYSENDQIYFKATGMLST